MFRNRPEPGSNDHEDDRDEGWPDAAIPGYKSNHRGKDEERQVPTDKRIQPAASQEERQCQDDCEDVTDRSISRRSCRESNTGQHSPTVTLLKRGSQGKTGRSRLIDDNRTQSSRNSVSIIASWNLGRDLLLFLDCQGTSQAPAGGFGAEATGKPLDSPVASLCEHRPPELQAALSATFCLVQV